MRLKQNPQVADVSDLTIKWMVHEALARRGNNLEKALNGFTLSWHTLSMQQTERACLILLGRADSQPDLLLLESNARSPSIE